MILAKPENRQRLIYFAASSACAFAGRSIQATSWSSKRECFGCEVEWDC